MGGKLWVLLGVLVVGAITATAFITVSRRDHIAVHPAMSARPSAVPRSEGRVALVKPTPTPTASAGAASAGGGGGGSGSSGTQSATAPNNGVVSTQQGGFTGGDSGTSSDDRAQQLQDQREERAQQREERQQNRDSGDTGCDTCP
jgi:hypothetical protein